MYFLLILLQKLKKLFLQQFKLIIIFLHYTIIDNFNRISYIILYYIINYYIII